MIAILKNNQSGVAHIAAILIVFVAIAIGVVGWRIWSIKAGQNFDESLAVVGKFCNESRNSSNIPVSHVEGSKKAITSIGFSEGFINKNFWPVSMEDSSAQNDAIEYITWHYCVNGYSGRVVIVKDTNSNKYILLGNNSGFSDFISTISVVDALKRMQACGGVTEEEYTMTNNLKGETTLNIQLGSPDTSYYQAPPDSKFKTAPLLVSESKKYPVTEFGGSQVYVSLIDGSCYTSTYIGPV